MGDPRSLWPFLLLGIAASVLLALGLLLVKSRGEALPAAHGTGIVRALIKWIRDPVWLGGLGIETLGYALYIIALAAAPVSLVAVMMQGGIALFVIFAVAFLHERAQVWEWVGIAGIVAAMILLALSLQSGTAEAATDPRALVTLSIGAIIAASAPSLVKRLRTSGAAAAVASGIAFGLGSLYTKALTDAFIAQTNVTFAVRLAGSPWLYLTIAANLFGLVLLQNSFHWARGIIAMPLSSACSNVVPIVGGMIAFGETLPANRFAAAMRISAFALTIGAGALLAVAAGSSGTRLVGNTFGAQ
jgi:hypothetical protein